MPEAALLKARALLGRLKSGRLVESLEEQVFLGRSSAFIPWRHGVMHEADYRALLGELPARGGTEVLAYRGRILRLLGDKDSARRALALSLRSPRAPAAAHAWLWELDSADWKCKALHINAAVKREPENGWWRCWKGLHSLRFDQARWALPEFERAAGLLPGEALPFALSAIALLRLEKPAEAQTLLNRAAALDPSIEWVFRLRSLARRELGDWPGAEADCDAAMRLEENMNPLLVLMGLLHEPLEPRAMLERATKAIAENPRAYWAYVYRSDARRSPDVAELGAALEDLEKAAEIRPACFWIWTHLGRTRVFLGRYREAGEALRRSLALEPNCGWTHAWLGEYLRRAGDKKGAEKAFHRCLELYPDYELAYTGRGAARREIGKPARAVPDLTMALRLDPTNQWSYYERYLAYRALERWPEAFRDLEAAHLRNPKFVWEDRAENFRAALAALKRAVRKHPKEPLGYLWLGDLRMRLGDFAGAEVFLGRAAALAPKLARAWILRGRARGELGRWKAAFADFDRAVRLDPDSPLPSAWRGRARQLRGDLDGAVRDFSAAIGKEASASWAVDEKGELHFRRAKAHQPGQSGQTYLERLAIPSAWIWVWKGETEYRRRRYSAAIRDMDKALEIHPKDVDARLWRGAARLARGELEAARADLDAALALRPGYARPLFFRGQLQRRLGLAPEAREDFRAALKTPGECSHEELALMRSFMSSEESRAATSPVKTLLARSRQSISQGRHADAAELLSEALKSAPEGVEILRLRAEAWRCLGRYDSALADLEAVADLEPGRAGPLVERGDMKRHLYDFAGGIADAESALALGEDASAWVLKSECQRGLGRYAGAVRSASRAAKADGRWSWALVVRAKAKRWQGDLKGALRDIAAARRLAPDDPYPFGWGGEILRKAGRLEEAVAELSEALRLAPHIAWFLAVRAEAKRELGRTAEGLADIQRAVRIDGNCSCAFDFIGAAPPAVAGDPKLAWVFAWRGGIHRKEERLAQARADLDSALALDSGCFWARAWRGELSAKEGRAREALADLDAALKTCGAYADAQLWRGRALLADGDPRAALEAFERSVELDPQQVWALIGRAVCLERLGRGKDARKTLSHARRLSPGTFAQLERPSPQPSPASRERGNKGE